MRPWSSPGGRAGPAGGGGGPPAQAPSARTEVKTPALSFRHPTSGGRTGALGVVHALRGRRVFLQESRGPHRAGLEVTAAVRADAVQPVPGAVLAEGALEGADQGSPGIGRQVLVA